MSGPVRSTNPIFTKNSIVTNFCPADYDISGLYFLGKNRDDSFMSIHNIPRDCTRNFFKDDFSEENNGCCITRRDERCLDDRYSVGIQVLDPSGYARNVCIDVPFKDKLPDFKKFFSVLVATLIGVIISSIFASCTEFWFKYGKLCNAFYYVSKCDNEKTPLGLIDYLFPKDLTSYPYPNLLNEEGRETIVLERTKPKSLQQTGGTFINNPYFDGPKFNCAKSYTPINFEGINPCHAWLGKLMNIGIYLPIFETMIKSFNIAFIIPLWLFRLGLNKLYTSCSGFYQEYVEKSDEYKNGFFIFCYLLWAINIILILISQSIMWVGLVIYYFFVIALVFMGQNEVKNYIEYFFNKWHDINKHKRHPFRNAYTEIFPSARNFNLENRNGDKFKWAPKIVFGIYGKGIYPNSTDKKVYQPDKYFKKLFTNEHSEGTDFKIVCLESAIPILYFIGIILYIRYWYSQESGVRKVHDLIPAWFLLGWQIVAILFLFTSYITFNNKGENNAVKNHWQGFVQFLNLGFFITRLSWILPVWFFLLLSSWGWWLLMFSIGTVAGITLSTLYFMFTSIFKFFWAPLYNYKRLLHIIKSHGILLTIILCIVVIVIGNSFAFLKSEVASVMTLILVSIILYKLYYHFKK